MCCGKHLWNQMRLWVCRTNKLRGHTPNYNRVLLQAQRSSPLGLQIVDLAQICLDRAMPEEVRLPLIPQPLQVHQKRGMGGRKEKRGGGRLGCCDLRRAASAYVFPRQSLQLASLSPRSVQAYRQENAPQENRLKFSAELPANSPALPAQGIALELFLVRDSPKEDSDGLFCWELVQRSQCTNHKSRPCQVTFPSSARARATARA